MHTHTLLRAAAVALVPLIGALAGAGPAFAHGSGDEEQDPVRSVVCAVDAQREGCPGAETGPEAEPAPAEGAPAGFSA